MFFSGDMYVHSKQTNKAICDIFNLVKILKIFFRPNIIIIIANHSFHRL